LSDSEKIERLERQTELLQKQLKVLQSEIAATKKKAAKVEAVQAEIAHTKKKAAEVEAVQAGSAAATPASTPANSPEVKAPPLFPGVKFTLYGYAEAATVFRARNQVNDMLTVFNAIPYPSSPLYKEHAPAGVISRCSRCNGFL
jgi:hypothetical protein